MVTWLNYFMGLARHVSIKSKDPSTKVGAAAVGPAKNILETGYNGFPRGVEDRPERMVRPEKYLWTGHAEENLVAHAARPRLEGSTVFVTHFCCSRCCRMLINAGVKRIVVGDGTTSMPDDEFRVAEIMFHEAKVEIIYEDDYMPDEDIKIW